MKGEKGNRFSAIGESWRIEEKSHQSLEASVNHCFFGANERSLGLMDLKWGLVLDKYGETVKDASSLRDVKMSDSVCLSSFS